MHSQDHHPKGAGKTFRYGPGKFEKGASNIITASVPRRTIGARKSSLLRNGVNIFCHSTFLISNRGFLVNGLLITIVSNANTKKQTIANHPTQLVRGTPSK